MKEEGKLQNVRQDVEGGECCEECQKHPEQSVGGRCGGQVLLGGVGGGIWRMEAACVDTGLKK